MSGTAGEVGNSKRYYAEPRTHAPHGLKRKRERENYDFAHRLLRQDVSARRKGMRRK